jgi:DNA-binding MarR family transcriptional regulator
MTLSQPAADPIGVIEIELMKLIRQVEDALGRRSSLYDQVDRSGYLALRTLDQLGPATSRALADALHLDSSTIARQVGTLTRSGLLQRRSDPADRRSAILTLTDQGREVMRRVERNRRHRMQEIVQSWNDTDLGHLVRSLTLLNDSLGASVTPNGRVTEAPEPSRPRHDRDDHGGEATR